MPLWHTRSGPNIKQSDGTVRTPVAIRAECEECGSPRAPFGDVIKGKQVRFCGWDREAMKPICINQAGSTDLFE